jgi:DNA-binding transcriptional LysR family regulator
VELLYPYHLFNGISFMSNSSLHERTGKLAWEDFKTVLAISRNGSLSGAARDLNIEHSTVFRRISDIEKRLGMKLFIRQRNGYLCNSHGEAIADTARSMEDAVLATERRLLGADQLLQGSIRIATSEMLGSYLLPHLLPDFLTLHPKIEIEVDVSNQPVDLTRREADLALRATLLPPDHLIARNLGGIETAVYAARQLVPETYDENILDQLPWIGFDERLMALPQAKWMRERLPHIVPRLRMDSFLAILRSAAIGAGAANLPCFAAAQESALMRISQSIEGPRMPIWLLSHPDLRGSARVRALLQYLTERIPETLNRLVGSGNHATCIICPMPQKVKKRTRSKDST